MLVVGIKSIELGNFNGWLITVVSFLTPIMKYHAKIIGFKNNLWIGACTTVLIYFYIFSPSATISKLSFLLVIILFFAIVGIFHKGDVVFWVPFGVYTLYCVVLVDSFFPTVLNYVYPRFLHQENRLLLRGTVFDYGFLVLNTIMVCLLIIDSYKKYRNKQYDTLLTVAVSRLQ